MIKRFTFIGIFLVALLVFASQISAVSVGQAGTTLLGEKTATGSWVRTFGWNVEKLVSPSVWNLFRGDSGTSEWIVRKGYSRRRKPRRLDCGLSAGKGLRTASGASQGQGRRIT